jgi:molybdopterin-binding protein
MELAPGLIAQAVVKATNVSIQLDRR